MSSTEPPSFLETPLVGVMTDPKIAPHGGVGASNERALLL